MNKLNLDENVKYTHSIFLNRNPIYRQCYAVLVFHFYARQGTTVICFHNLSIQHIVKEWSIGESP